MPASEHAELEALRAELKALRAEAARLRGQAARRPRRPHRLHWRPPVATLLIVLGCLLAPDALVAVWTANQVSDTNRYVHNVAPLIDEPSIQRVLTDKITNAIVTQIDLPKRTSQVTAVLNQKGLGQVATLLQGFSGSLASLVQGFVHDQLLKIIASPPMASAWVQANRRTHSELVKALSGRGGGAISVSNDQVTLDLAPFIDIAKQNVAAQGLTIVNSVPTVHVTLALFPSRDLVRGQRAYRLINDLKIVLPVLALTLLALGVFVARDRRRALIAAALGFAASMLLLWIALRIARDQYLNAVPSNVLPSDAAAAAFDILVRFISNSLAALLAAGIVVAAAAFLTGPAAVSVRIRAASSAALGGIRRRGQAAGLHAGGAGNWTYVHRRALRTGAAALAVLWFLLAGYPDALVVVLIVAVLLMVTTVIELIGIPH